MMRSYFNFHVSIEVLLILQKKLELQLHCVFSSGRPKSNKMLNKNKIFWPLQKLTNIE